MLLAHTREPVPDNHIEVPISIDVTEGRRQAQHRLAPGWLVQAGFGERPLIAEQIEISVQIARPEQVQPAIAIKVDQGNTEYGCVFVPGYIDFMFLKALTVLIYEDVDLRTIRSNNVRPPVPVNVTRGYAPAIEKRRKEVGRVEINCLLQAEQTAVITRKRYGVISRPRL